MMKKTDSKVISMKIERTSLSDRVAEELQAMIRSAEYQVGDKLPTEGELMEKFSVSRITIREAVRKLRTMGLLEVRQGDGTFVKELTPTSFMKPLLSMLTLDKKNLRDIFEVRLVIECKSAELAAQRAEEEALRNMQTYLNRMDTAIAEGNREHYNEADMLFHYEILKSSGNQIILAIGDMIVSMIRDSISASISPPNALANSITMHKKIYTAISQKDPAEAVAAMKQHLEGGASYIETI